MKSFNVQAQRFNKQLLDEVEHDIMYKPSASADNTDTRF